MQLVLGLVLAVFFTTSLAVGLALVRRAPRNAQRLELLIGIGILGIGPGGMGGLFVAVALEAIGSDAAPYMSGAAVLAILAGGIAGSTFNRLVYRPESSLARFAVLAVVLIGSIGFGIELGTSRFADPFHPGPGTRIISAITVPTMLWGSIESLRYWLLMRRRLAIGLADPVVTNRFLLWGIGIGSAGVGALVAVVAQETSNLGMNERPGLMLGTAIVGLLSALVMWVAFVPPAAWRHHLEARARAAALASSSPPPAARQ